MAKSDKTEKATPKRRSEARKEGQIARSAELGSWLAVLVGSYLLPEVTRSAKSRLEGLMALGLGGSGLPHSSIDLSVLDAGLSDAALVVAPAVVAMALLAVVVGFSQVGIGFSSKALRPKFARLNPVSGVKKLLSPTGLVELVKVLVKVALVSLLAWHSIAAVAQRFAGTTPASLFAVAGAGAGSVLALVRSIAFAGLVVAVGDYAYQRHHLEKSLRMTKQEVKDESRQAEGDPHMKGQIRGRQRKISRMRMMAAIADADVVAVNPTHFAVALKYESAGGGAPVVVAKGADEMAARIREEASRHSVPVVANPPLARALFAACEVDDEIPPELYSAVAELLAFIYRLPRMARTNGDLRHRSATLPA